MMNRDIRNSYSELLHDGRWIQFSMDIIRDCPQCKHCGGTDHLQLHHKGYKQGRQPWDYGPEEMMVLCRQCHENLHHWADKLWNEVLKLTNQWKIYECSKAIERIIDIDRSENENRELAQLLQSARAGEPVRLKHEPGNAMGLMAQLAEKSTLQPDGPSSSSQLSEGAD